MFAPKNTVEECQRKPEAICHGKDTARTLATWLQRDGDDNDTDESTSEVAARDVSGAGDDTLRTRGTGSNSRRSDEEYGATPSRPSTSWDHSYVAITPSEQLTPFRPRPSSSRVHLSEESTLSQQLSPSLPQPGTSGVFSNVEEMSSQRLMPSRPRPNTRGTHSHEENTPRQQLTPSRPRPSARGAHSPEENTPGQQLTSSRPSASNRARRRRLDGVTPILGRERSGARQSEDVISDRLSRRLRI